MKGAVLEDSNYVIKVKLPGLVPFLYSELPASTQENTVLYGKRQICCNLHWQSTVISNPSHSLISLFYLMYVMGRHIHAMLGKHATDIKLSMHFRM